MAGYVDISNLETAFNRLGQKDWRLFSGKPKSIPTGVAANRTLLAQSSDGVEDIESSWSELAGWMQGIAQGGGNAVLFLGPKNTEPIRALDITLSRRMMPDPPSQENRPGLTGAAMGYNQTLQLMMENYDLKRQIEDLSHPGGSVWEQIGARLIESINFDTLISALMKQPSGVLNNSPVNPSQSISDNTQAAKVAGAETLEDVAESLITTIAAHLDDDEEKIMRFLKGIEKTIARNPSIINQLAQ